LLAAGLLSWAGAALGQLPAPLTALLDGLSGFAAVFLGIFIEATPYLLLGTLASGLVETFLPPGELAHWIPRGKLGGAAAGGLLGLFFPVCECGVVPFARRLMRKGLPLSSAVALLLAAPVVNPVVIASTFTAFGAGAVLWGRLGFSFLIAVIAGSLAPRFAHGAVLRGEALEPVLAADPQSALSPSIKTRLRQVLLQTADEFFEMGRYLVVGALLAALMQSFVPQSVLLALGKGPVLSVLVMLALAALLSVCSTVDAFIALAFASSFSPGAVIAFLVFGPMVDIKSLILYSRVFRPRVVLLLAGLPFLLSLALGIVWNLAAR
jgi:uncharacterized protein